MGGNDNIANSLYVHSLATIRINPRPASASQQHHIIMMLSVMIIVLLSPLILMATSSVGIMGGYIANATNYRQ
jgi:hypothetical protein